MKVFANGSIVDETEAVVSIFDRSFLYGDGVFETVRIFNGNPFRWEQHMSRLFEGASTLGIKIPMPAASIRTALTELVTANESLDSILRITLSRGVGRRGYSPTGAGPPSLFMSLHPAPPLPPGGPGRWRLITSSVRIPSGNLITRHKTANRLLQVLARAEADRVGADDALMLNSEGLVCETASANLFWIETGTLCTPAGETGLLPGITRTVVIEIARTLGWKVREPNSAPRDIVKSDGAFATLSSFGIVELDEVDGQRLARSPMTAQLNQEYLAKLHEETV